MKRLILFGIALTLILALSACIMAIPDEKNGAVPDIKDLPEESDMQNPSSPDIDGNALGVPVGGPDCVLPVPPDCAEEPLTPDPDVVMVVKIVNTATPDMAFAQALEKVYEDKNATYYFSCIMSGCIIVYYSDGTQEDIKTALNEGILTIEEAKQHGIRFIEESKNLVER